MSRTLSLLAAAVAGSAFLPFRLAAHEGHGPESTLAGVVHWLSSPYHLISVVVVVALLAALAVGAALRHRSGSAREVAPEA